jgi:hypothetical protein
MDDLIARISHLVRVKGHHPKHYALEKCSQKMLYYVFEPIAESFLQLIEHPDSLYMYMIGRTYRTLKPAEFFARCPTMTPADVRAAYDANPFLFYMRSPEGRTPLHALCQSDNRDLVHAFLNLRVDPTIKDDQGNNVFTMACAHMDFEEDDAIPIVQLPHRVLDVTRDELAICRRAMRRCVAQRRMEALYILLRCVPHAVDVGLFDAIRRVCDDDPLLIVRMESALGRPTALVEEYRNAQRSADLATERVLHLVLGARVFFPDDLPLVRAASRDAAAVAARLRCTTMDPQVKYAVFTNMQATNRAVVEAIIRYRNDQLLQILREHVVIEQNQHDVGDDVGMMAAVFSTVARVENLQRVFCDAHDLDIAPSVLFEQNKDAIVVYIRTSDVDDMYLGKVIRRIIKMNALRGPVLRAIESRMGALISRGARIMPKCMSHGYMLLVVDIMASVGYQYIVNMAGRMFYKPAFYVRNVEKMFTDIQSAWNRLDSANEWYDPLVVRVRAPKGPFVCVTLRNVKGACTLITNDEETELEKSDENTCGSMLYVKWMDHAHVRCTSLDDAMALEAWTFPCVAYPWTRDTFVVSCYNAQVVCHESVVQRMEIPVKEIGIYRNMHNLMTTVDMDRVGEERILRMMTDTAFAYIGPPCGVVLSLSLTASFAHVWNYIARTHNADSHQSSALYNPSVWPQHTDVIGACATQFVELCRHIRTVSETRPAESAEDIAFSAAAGGLIMRHAICIILAASLNDSERARFAYEAMLQSFPASRNQNWFHTRASARMYLDMHPALASRSDLILRIFPPPEEYVPRSVPQRPYEVSAVYMFAWQLLSSGEEPDVAPPPAPDIPHEHSMHILLQRFRVATQCAVNEHARRVYEQLQRLRPEPESKFDELAEQKTAGDEQQVRRRRVSSDVDPFERMKRTYPRITSSICAELNEQYVSDGSWDRYVSMSRNATKKCVFFDTHDERDAFVTLLLPLHLAHVRQQLLQSDAAASADAAVEELLADNGYCLARIKQEEAYQRSLPDRIEKQRQHLAGRLRQAPMAPLSDTDVRNRLIDVLRQPQPRDRTTKTQWKDVMARHVDRSALETEEAQLLVLQSLRKHPPTMAASAAAPAAAAAAATPECAICFNDATVQHYTCGHWYCNQCFWMNLESNNTLRCPQDACHGRLVRERLSEEDWVRCVAVVHRPMRARAVVERECRACHRPYAVLQKEQTHMTSIECIHCHTISCAFCAGAPHDGLTCAHNSMRLQSDIPSLDSADEVDRSQYRACFNCGVQAFRDGGCASMKCGACKTNWCWDCGGPSHAHVTSCPKSAVVTETAQQHKNMVRRQIDQLIPRWAFVSATKSTEVDTMRVSAIQTCVMLQYARLVHRMERPTMMPRDTRLVETILHDLIRCIDMCGSQRRSTGGVGFVCDILESLARGERVKNEVEEELHAAQHLLGRLISVYDSIIDLSQQIGVMYRHMSKDVFALICFINLLEDGTSDPSAKRLIQASMDRGRAAYIHMHSLAEQAHIQWSAAKDLHLRQHRDISDMLRNVMSIHEHHMFMIEHVHRTYVSALERLRVSANGMLIEFAGQPCLRRPVPVATSAHHIRRWDAGAILAQPAFRDGVPVAFDVGLDPEIYVPVVDDDMDEIDDVWAQIRTDRKYRHLGEYKLVQINEPADQPPADQPPADQPPADQPPADQPPADQPPADQPEVVEVAAAAPAVVDLTGDDEEEEDPEENEHLPHEE